MNDTKIKQSEQLKQRTKLFALLRGAKTFDTHRSPSPVLRTPSPSRGEGEGEGEYEQRCQTFMLGVIKIIQLFRSLPKTTEARILGNQLLKAGTSVAANYSEINQPSMMQ